MPSDGVMILITFGLIIFVPLAVVMFILLIARNSRERKKKNYKGFAQGTVEKIRPGGPDHPDVLYVSYSVKGVQYQVKETLKLKSEFIKLGGIPIGQRKTYKMGKLAKGDMVTVQYDEKEPSRAIILGNDGMVTG